MTARRPWQDFTGLRSQTFVPDMLSTAHDIKPHDLVDMASYNSPALSICTAYAQEELIYAGQKTMRVDAAEYSKIPRAERVNKFGLAYAPGSKLLLHKILAGIITGAAEHMYKTYGWSMIIYDGLRTIDGAFRLYNFATDEDIKANLLALPGRSAHNKGLAADSIMIDVGGDEIEMGGHFDHLDMSTNMRYYAGKRISDLAKSNRLLREAAFLRAAFTQGLLVAPLRNEFWDDRLPENRGDLWRVLDSAARVTGIEYQLENKESWNYPDFLANWQRIFKGHEQRLEAAIGHTSPPQQEKPEFYHGNYNPLYDSEIYK